jgi:hypothetical protein
MAARIGGRLLFLKQQQYGKLLYNNNKSCSSPLVVSVAAPLLHSVLESQEESMPAGLLRAASQLSQGRYHQFLLFQVYEEDEEVWPFFLSFFFRLLRFLFSFDLQRAFGLVQQTDAIESGDYELKTQSKQSQVDLIEV